MGRGDASLSPEGPFLFRVAKKRLEAGHLTIVSTGCMDVL
jgi:hypothetical protein